jgi:ribosomal protein S18 acetylase RimI-like enzyme
MALTISSATLGDLPDLVRMNREVQRFHARLAPDVYAQDCDEKELSDYWREQLGEERNRVRVARVDGRIVGYVWFEIQERPRTLFKLLRRRIYVHHIGVSADHRGTRVAVSLLNDVEATARAFGVRDLELEASAANAIALSFFRKQGYHERFVVMSRHLDA